MAPGRWSKVNLAWDLVAVAVAFLLAGEAPLESLFELGLFELAMTAVWVVGAGALQLYDPWKRRVPLDDFALTCVVLVAIVVLTAAARFVSPALWLALPAPGDLFVFLLAAIGLPRVFVFRKLATREDPIDDVLIAGTGPMAKYLGQTLQSQHPRRRVAGYLRISDESRVVVPPELVLGSVDADLERCVRRLPVGEVYFAGRITTAGRQLENIILTCERMGLPFALPASPLPMGRARLASPNSVPDGFLHFVPFASRPLQRGVKRLFDVVVSAVGLLLLSPLLIAVAAAIKLTSRGPIFFAQNRVGLHGRPFKMLKFRSMVVNAEALKERLAAQNEQTGPVFKITNDPRVTRVGRFIRKHSIDELPQLLNVLRGDMSVVGPRPPVPPEVAQYEPWQLRRLSVRPGLTCIWQVSGRNQISFDEWMALDMRYIDHWSFWSDLSLILKTVPVVLTGRGAS